MVASGEGSGESVLERVGSAGIRFGVHWGQETHQGVVLHGGGWRPAAGGERRGERRPVTVAPSSWLGEVRGAQAVLAVASARRFHGQRCRSVWQRSR
jgi:triphosphoribosyl-dephospho-CoA synthetase